ncbi:hypothetical protein ACQKGO_02010 [Corallococcus interemptor]|uniref:hypothetical protein n=1 Tax=Corallococcus interemptor TaxID=2316720 RepID=UPI003D019802
MRSRVLFSLCISGLLLACARGGARSTPSTEVALSGSGPVSPCATNPEPPHNGGVVVGITVSEHDKVHFSSQDVTVNPGQTVYFVSDAQQDRCIVVADGGILAEGGLLLADGGVLVSEGDNPLLVPGCQVAFWTLKATDTKGTVDWSSCPAASDGGCSHCVQTPGIRETINGKLEVTSGGGV